MGFPLRREVLRHVAGIVAVSIGLGCGNTDAPVIVAEVAGSSITAADVRQAVAKIVGEEVGVGDLSFSEKLTVLEALLAVKVLILEAERRNIDSSESVAGPLQTLERQLLKDAIYERDVWAAVAATDSAIRAQYEQWGDGEEVNASHILVRTIEEAEEILQLLESGVDFAELARKRSVHVASSSGGGSMGFMKRHNLLKPIADVVWGAVVDEVYLRPIRTRLGFHVVVLTDRRRRTMDEQRAAIVSHLERLEKYRADRKFKERLKIDYEFRWHPETALMMAQLDATMPGDRILCQWRDGSLDVAAFVRRAQVPNPVSDDTARTRAIGEDLALDLIIAVEARKRGYHELNRVRNTLGQKRLQLISEALYEAEVGGSEAHAAEVIEFYEANKEKYHGRIRISIREILVDTEALADSLYDRILAGEDMAELARRYTVRMDLRPKSGLWEDITPDHPRSAKIYRIALEGVVGLREPIKVPGGYSVFDVLDKRPGKQLSLEESEESLRQDMATLAMDRFIGDLRNRYAQRIRIHEDVLRAVE